MVSNDVNGFFESKFNSNIIIEPNSKIGLLSFSGTLAPIEEFIKPQGRFKHLFKSDQAVIPKIQQYVDTRWQELLKMCSQ